MSIGPSILSSSIYMTLNFRAKSEEARRFISEVEAIAFVPSLKFRLTAKVRDTLNAVVSDLMKAAQVEGRYSYRQTASGSFTGERIGYTTFIKVQTALQTVGLIEVVKGIGGGTERAWATRFRANDELLRLAEAHGVTVANWSDHFEALARPKAIPRPIVLKTSSRRLKGAKRPGLTVAADLRRSPAREIGERVNGLNAYFADVAIDPAESHIAFQRIFNQTEQPTFDWNKGGRIYSIGDSYQLMPRSERAKLKLNGEEVVELDLRASHLTILHALLDAPFDQGIDPYGVPDIPRDVAKAWVTMTLGHDRFQRRWSKESKAKHKERTGRDLQAHYPISEVRKAMLSHLPALADWPSIAPHVNWADLQFIESEIVIGTVEILAKHGVPALPVHDSIIVPKSRQQLATKVLQRSFERVTRVKPAIMAS